MRMHAHTHLLLILDQALREKDREMTEMKVFILLAE